MKIRMLSRVYEQSLIKDLINKYVQRAEGADDDKEKSEYLALEARQRKKLANMKVIRTSIPVYIIGFTGWKTLSTLREKFKKLDRADGLINLDPLKGVFRTVHPNQVEYVECFEGPEVLVKLLDCLCRDVIDIDTHVPTLWNYH